MSSYAIYLEKRAERDLKSLPKEYFDRIITQIKNLAQNPHPLGCRKISGAEQDWRIRVGTYRILYEVNEKSKQVHVMKIQHRKDVYR